MGKIEKTRELKKLSMRKAREKMKAENPEKYEEQKQKDRERKKATRKKIHELSERDKRSVRKGWKERTKRSREMKKKRQQLIEYLSTPPESPIVNIPINNELDFNVLPGPSQESSSRKSSGLKIRRKYRDWLKKKLQKLEEKNKLLKQRGDKYKQKFYRLQSAKDNTPRKVVKKMTSGTKCSKEVKKSLLFSEVLKTQIQSNFSTERCINKKKVFARVLSGKVITKYRLQRSLNNLTSRYILPRNPYHTHQLSNIIKQLKLKMEVQNFLEKDSSSRLTAGKKETITRNKLKKQKRPLNDTMLNLYNDFKQTNEFNSTSYSTFCKLRPFWVVQPDFRKRDTCLCIDHENFALVLEKLYTLKMLAYKYPTDLLKSITCDAELRESCLERKCGVCCLNKKIVCKEFEN